MLIATPSTLYSLYDDDDGDDDDDDDDDDVRAVLQHHLVAQQQVERDQLVAVQASSPACFTAILEASSAHVPGRLAQHLADHHGLQHALQRGPEGLEKASWKYDKPSSSPPPRSTG